MKISSLEDTRARGKREGRKKEGNNEKCDKNEG